MDINAGKHWLVYLGIMTESTKRWNQRDFHIYISELSPFHEGDVSPEYVNIPVCIENVATKVTESKDIKVTKTVKADYFGVESSRSVPTVAKGQQVLVINYGNTDKYYWVPLERDDNLKTFERIRVSCANVATINKAPVDDPEDIEAKKATLTDDNTYFFEMDTRDKKIIKISTSDSDGEKWRYFFKIDPEEQTVELWDQHTDKNTTEHQPNNLIKLESKPKDYIKGRITLQNASNTTIILEDKNLIINVPGNMMLNVGGDILTKIGNDAATRIGHDNNLVIGNNNGTIIGKNNGVIIGNDDSLEVANNRIEKVNNNNTVLTKNSFTESQKNRTSTTEELTAWKSKTWTQDITDTTKLTTIKYNLVVTDHTVISKKFTHTATNATIKYAVCLNTILRISGDPILTKSII